jgi:pyruvate dehydrogenase E2 component (dihydrolipoamide acetyltransferase)
MGLEVSEGTIVAFHVAVGASVAEGDPLVEVETDKALTDVVAPRDGIVIGLDADVGDTVAVGGTLVRLGDHADESAADATPAAGEPAPVAAAESAPAAAAEPAAAPAAAAGAPDGATGAHRIRAAPVARRAASRLGVALEAVAGTGPRGRITLGDVERAAEEGSNGAAAAQAPATAAAPGGERREPMSATRRAIARRMTESQQIPQFGLGREIDATWLLAEKRRLTDAGAVKVSVNDLLIQALAEAVVRNPGLAVSYAPDPDGGHPQLLRRDDVDVGLAVATDRGLLVPVIRRAHERPLTELVLERSRLVEAARSGRIDLAEMTGATVSLSSLAAFGVDRFGAMLNPGESAILAVGRAVDRVVPRDRGFAVVPMVALTLTVDHRVVDGATGGHALADLADLLEGAMTWRP